MQSLEIPYLLDDSRQTARISPTIRFDALIVLMIQRLDSFATTGLYLVQSGGDANESDRNQNNSINISNTISTVRSVLC